MSPEHIAWRGRCNAVPHLAQTMPSELPEVYSRLCEQSRANKFCPLCQTLAYVCQSKCQRKPSKHPLRKELARLQVPICHVASQRHTGTCNADDISKQASHQEDVSEMFSIYSHRCRRCSKQGILAASSYLLLDILYDFLLMNTSQWPSTDKTLYVI